MPDCLHTAYFVEKWDLLPGFPDDIVCLWCTYICLNLQRRKKMNIKIDYWGILIWRNIPAFRFYINIPLSLINILCLTFLWLESSHFVPTHITWGFVNKYNSYISILLALCSFTIFNMSIIKEYLWMSQSQNFYSTDCGPPAINAVLELSSLVAIIFTLAYIHIHSFRHNIQDFVPVCRSNVLRFMSRH